MKAKILIIEDESILLESLSKELSPNYYVIEAVNGAEGLDTALSTKPDIILLDILLPKMSGEDLLAKLREDPWGKNAKVIVITNLEDAKLKKNLINLGVVDYLIKSNVTMKELSEIILKTLNPTHAVYFNISKD